MLKKIFYICMILTFCFAPLTGCDQGSTTPTPTPDTDPNPAPDFGSGSKEPLHFVIDAKICQITVDSSFDEDGNQDFMMDVVYMKKDLFFIQIDGSNPLKGAADGVDVDVFGQDLMSWGTLK